MSRSASGSAEKARGEAGKEIVKTNFRINLSQQGVKVVRVGPKKHLREHF